MIFSIRPENWWKYWKPFLSRKHKFHIRGIIALSFTWLNYNNTVNGCYSLFLDMQSISKWVFHFKLSGQPTDQIFHIFWENILKDKRSTMGNKFIVGLIQNKTIYSFVLTISVKVTPTPCRKAWYFLLASKVRFACSTRCHLIIDVLLIKHVPNISVKIELQTVTLSRNFCKSSSITDKESQGKKSKDSSVKIKRECHY